MAVCHKTNYHQPAIESVNASKQSNIVKARMLYPLESMQKTRKNEWNQTTNVINNDGDRQQGLILYPKRTVKELSRDAFRKCYKQQER